MAKQSKPESEEFDAYVTVYALSKGIFKIRARATASGGMIADVSRSGVYYHREGGEWCRTPEAACARATEMRRNKILSLKKQIDRVEALHFSPDDIK